jgi:hypothetical protein
MRVTYSYTKGEFDKAMRDIEIPMDQAAIDSVREATDIAHKNGQANIAASGLGPRWVKSFKQRFYKNTGLDAAGIVYSTIQFSYVFERGATVRGNPNLWIPLPTTPLKIGGKRMTAKRATHEIGHLFKIVIGGKEFLALRIAVSKGIAKGPVPRMSAAMLKSRARKPRKNETTRLIPMFVGSASITIRKRLNISEIVQRAADQLPDLYDQFQTANE